MRLTGTVIENHCLKTIKTPIQQAVHFLVSSKTEKERLLPALSFASLLFLCYIPNLIIIYLYYITCQFSDIRLKTKPSGIYPRTPF